MASLASPWGSLEGVLLVVPSSVLSLALDGTEAPKHQAYLTRVLVGRVVGTDLVDEILTEVRAGRVRSAADLQRAKLNAVRRHKALGIPSNADLLAALDGNERDRLRPLLRRKATRTASGVAIVAVQTSPEWCPHGTCTYCPGGPPSQSAKSYTGFEPAALRAGRHAFDPYAQVWDRVQQLRAIGHDTDKIDLILMGGTLTARDLDYQQWFVKRCYDAMNDDGKPSTNLYGAKGALTLEEAMQRNEEAENRCIGLTVETKPDWALEQHVDIMLGFGATRVELGVQTLHEDVLERVHRGHGIEHTRRSTRILKDAGMKLVYHMMLGLPGCDAARDLQSLRGIFEDERYRPDMLKLYPTLVVPGTQLYEAWKRGEYEPYGTDEAADVIAQAKRVVPEWVRIQRVDRDIPTPMISAGVDKSNLRQIALKRLEEARAACRCIRCREVGLRADQGRPDHVELVERDYRASGGRELFLALEDPSADTIHAYLRLRIPGKGHRPELSSTSHSIIRELKVHGQMLAFGQRETGASQHRGLGKRLLDEAARWTFDDLGLDRMFVLSGVGVKAYYRRLGFEDDGVYLSRGR